MTPFVCVAGRFGRRTISIISAMGFLLSSVSVAFVTHYSLFLTFRFFVAAFGSGFFLPNFVIGKLHCAGRRWMSLWQGEKWVLGFGGGTYTRETF